MHTARIFSIYMDDDALIHAGSGLDQVTWMDVRVGDWVATPRHGKPVEINALWYNALCVTAELAEHFKEDSSVYRQLATRVSASFRKEFWNEKMDAFEKENNCEVNVEIIPWDNYEEKYLTGVNSNDGPDVGYLYMEMFYDYIDMGALADIDEYFTDDEKANYLYYDLGNIQDGQYALPVVVGNPRLLAANMDILKEAGVDAVPTNWDELKAACEAVKASNPDVAPLSATWGSTHYGALNEVYWPYFWGAGAQIVDEDGNLTIDSEDGLKATQFLADMKEEGLIPETSTSTDDSLEPFKNGEAAMTVDSIQQPGKSRWNQLGLLYSVRSGKYKDICSIRQSGTV